MVRANNLLCDIEHMQKHFETTQEMVNRGMVVVEPGSQGRVSSPMAAMQQEKQCSSYMKETLKTFKQFSKKATVGVRICQGTNTCEQK